MAPASGSHSSPMSSMWDDLINVSAIEKKPNTGSSAQRRKPPGAVQLDSTLPTPSATPLMRRSTRPGSATTILTTTPLTAQKQVQGQRKVTPLRQRTPAAVSPRRRRTDFRKSMERVQQQQRPLDAPATTPPVSPTNVSFTETPFTADSLRKHIHVQLPRVRDDDHTFNKTVVGQEHPNEYDKFTFPLRVNKAVSPTPCDKQGRVVGMTQAVAQQLVERPVVDGPCKRRRNKWFATNRPSSAQGRYADSLRSRVSASRPQTPVVNFDDYDSEMTQLDGWRPNNTEVEDMAEQIVMKYRTSKFCQDGYGHTVWSWVWEGKMRVDTELIEAEVARVLRKRVERAPDGGSPDVDKSDYLTDIAITSMM